MALMLSLKRQRVRQLVTAALLTLFIYLCVAPPSFRAARPIVDAAYYRDKYPRLWEHVYLNGVKGERGGKGGRGGPGGAWYIPPDWLDPSDPQPTTILEAARLAYTRAHALSHTIPYSTIPLIVHQTWKDTKINTWAPDLARGVEQWLTYAAETGEGNRSMAYFLWLDDGCDRLVEYAEPQLVETLKALPLQVERSDVFRIVVLNSIGGIYGDIDTIPLRSPASWLDESDIQPWSDHQTGATYSTSSGQPLSPSPSHPVRLLLGIEGDNDPSTDTHWRMGYGFPVQLTQWALAAAPQHPILKRFIAAFSARIEEIATPYGGNLTAAAKAGVLRKEDPLKLTGPEAITEAARGWLAEEAGLRWEAVTGLYDGGRTKAVGSTVILPITAFSPGRSKYGNMGSKPITDPDARLQHCAQGSWRKLDLGVEFGKFCRTAFGRCRHWSKVPG